METACGNADIGSHGSIDPIAEAFARGVEIVEPATGHGIVWINDSGRFANNAIAFLPSTDILACLDNDAAEFMPENDGIIDGPAVLRGPLVEIAATHTDGSDS